MRTAAWGLMLSCAIVLAACSGDGRSGEQPGLGQSSVGIGSTGEEGRGILLARGDGLALRDGPTGKERLIVRSPSGGVLSYPRWSPDGTRIAYVITTYRIRPEQQQWGSTVFVDAADGSNPIVVLEPHPVGQQVVGLAWSADGTGLYLGTIDRTVAGSLQLERLDLTTDMRVTIAPGGAYPDVSPDGNWITFLTYSSDVEPGGLWMMSVDGTDKRRLLTTPEALVGLRLPRFAPDGRSLVFGGVAPADSGLVAPECSRGRRWPWEPPIAAAHGPPVGVWTLSLDSGALRHVSDLIEDDTSVMWSPDGTQLAVIGACGFYTISAADGAVQKVGEGSVSSQVDWR